MGDSAPSYLLIISDRLSVRAVSPKPRLPSFDRLHAERDVLFAGRRIESAIAAAGVRYGLLPVDRAGEGVHPLRDILAGWQREGQRTLMVPRSRQRGRWRSVPWRSSVSAFDRNTGTLDNKVRK